jgi:hypothetical protein
MKPTTACYWTVANARLAYLVVCCLVREIKKNKSREKLILLNKQDNNIRAQHQFSRHKPPLATKHFIAGMHSCSNVKEIQKEISSDVTQLCG